jgi:hypothetical protein
LVCGCFYNWVIIASIIIVYVTELISSFIETQTIAAPTIFAAKFFVHDWFQQVCVRQWFKGIGA